MLAYIGPGLGGGCVVGVSAVTRAEVGEARGTSSRRSTVVWLVD